MWFLRKTSLDTTKGAEPAAGPGLGHRRTLSLHTLQPPSYRADVHSAFHTEKGSALRHKQGGRLWAQESQGTLGVGRLGIRWAWFLREGTGFLAGNWDWQGRTTESCNQEHCEQGMRYPGGHGMDRGCRCRRQLTWTSQRERQGHLGAWERACTAASFLASGQGREGES